MGSTWKNVDGKLSSDQRQKGGAGPPLRDSIIFHGCFLRSCSVEHSIVGVRSRIEDGATLKVSMIWIECQVLSISWMFGEWISILCPFAKRIPQEKLLVSSVGFFWMESCVYMDLQHRSSAKDNGAWTRTLPFSHDSHLIAICYIILTQITWWF
jgi:hypothetical protein